jgi:hypothetical protein
MTKPNSFILENEIVYEAEKLYEFDTVYFYGCSRIRTIIDRKKLNDEDYIFGYIKDNKWIKSTKTYQKAKLLIKEDWVLNNVPKLMNEIIEINNNYEEAPEIFELDSNEKFKDEQGNIIEIEVRGERNYNKCYFKVKDISKGFEMPNLNTVILDKNTIYFKDIHYKNFIIKKINSVEHMTSKKYLFLTYNGILKVLFSSRSGNAESFQSWATEKLFTIHLGTNNMKEELASNLLGVNTRTIKEVFKTNSSKTPCVYLYLIGYAKDLLADSNIIYTSRSDDILCKYGCTDDLERRAGEHDKKFKKLFNCSIELLCFSIIESKYIFEAETNIIQYFKSNIIKYNNFKELIIINKKELEQVKQHYKMIQNSYIGRYEQMNNKIILLEKDIIKLNNDIQLINEKHKNDIQLINEKNKNELKDKDIQLLNEKHKNEIKDKDIQLLEYKLQFLTS